MFPGLPTAPAIRQKLNDHFGATNIAGDLTFMRGAGTFELPYGYAWLLRCSTSSGRGTTPTRALAANIQPMAAYMSERMVTYLKMLQQPVAPASIPIRRWRWTTRSAMRGVRPGRSTRRYASRRTASSNATSGATPPRAGSERLCVALLDGSGDHGPAQWIAMRSSMVDAFSAALYSAEFHPLRRAGAEYVKNPTAIASSRTSWLGIPCARRRWVSWRTRCAE